MDLFIPDIESSKYEEYYNKHRDIIIKEGYSISDRKIRGITYFQGEKENRVFVGDELWNTKDKIHLILFDIEREMYIILTPRHGLYAGHFATVGKRTVHMLKEYLFN
ncbi:MAG: hypothetical protein ABJR05_01315 [Balneola sp.]